MEFLPTFTCFCCQDSRVSQIEKVDTPLNGAAIVGTIDDSLKTAVGSPDVDENTDDQRKPDDGYLVSIQKKSDLGMVLGTVKELNLGSWTTGGLKIQKIRKGPIRKWNKAHPGEEVRENDLIVEVNGIAGSCNKLLDEIANARELNLRLLCPDSFTSISHRGNSISSTFSSR